MDSTENHLKSMLKELKSRSKGNVILESGLLLCILLFLFVGNFTDFTTLLVMVLNRRIRTVTNLFVASLAISDFCLGALFLFSLGLPTLATSQWPFSDLTCQYQGYVVISLVFPSTQSLALMARSEQVFSNRGTSEVSTLLQQKENHDHDCHVMVLFHVCPIT